MAAMSFRCSWAFESSDPVHMHYGDELPPKPKPENLLAIECAVLLPCYLVVIDYITFLLPP